MAVPALSTSVLTTADINTSISSDPRIMDLRLAEALGFIDPHKIRALIKRHMRVLQVLGEVSATRRKPSAQGGRPGTDYYLNKRQALYITSKSDTDQAAMVTVRMVDVFDAYLSGQPVAPPTPRLPRQLVAPTKGIGVVKLDRVIWFDTRRRPNIGELALVVRHNGALGVYPVVQSERQFEDGYVYVEDKEPAPWVLSVRSRVSLVGAVINANGKRKRAIHLAHRITA